MIYYGLLNKNYNKIRLVNHRYDYRVPELYEFFNDIKEIEVCNVKNAVVDHLTEMIWDADYSQLTWYITQWKYIWLEQDSFEKNINLLKELIDRGLIRIKIENTDIIPVLFKQPIMYSKLHTGPKLYSEGKHNIMLWIAEDIIKTKLQFGHNPNDYIKILNNQK